MKKKWGALLIGIIALGLSGCGASSVGNVEDVAGMLVDSGQTMVGLATPTNGQPAAVERWITGMAGSVQNFDVELDIDYKEVYSNIEVKIVERLTQKLVADELETIGITVETKEDGSTTFSAGNGSEITQKADGTWEVTYVEGTVEQLDGDWPDNEFTKQVPRPEFQPTAAMTNENVFSVAFVGTNVTEIRSYVEILKSAGFTVNAEEKDVEVFGMIAYSYAASNESGYRVEVTYASDMCGMTITKE